MSRSIGRYVVESLAANGIDTVFRYSRGSQSRAVPRPCRRDMRHVLVRHEQGAGFAADGYARLTGRAAAAFTISGPGLTNILTAAAQAYSDSIPLLVVATTPVRASLGKQWGVLHELPISARSPPACSASRASARERRGRSRPPAPVPCIACARAARDPPISRSRSTCSPRRRRWRPSASRTPRRCRRRPRHRGRSAPARRGGAAGHHRGRRRARVRRGAARARGNARLPARHDRGRQGLAAARSIPPTSAPRCIMPAVQKLVARRGRGARGRHGIRRDRLLLRAEARARRAARFASTSIRTSSRDHYAAEVPIWADARPTLAALHRGAACRARVRRHRRRPVCAACAPRSTARSMRRHAAGRARSRRSAPRCRAMAPCSRDMTQIAYFGNYAFPVDAPRRWFHPSGYGTLGFALPAAIGAKIASPARAVVALAGDFGLQFTLGELDDRGRGRI